MPTQKIPPATTPTPTWAAVGLKELQSAVDALNAAGHSDLASALTDSSRTEADIKAKSVNEFANETCGDCRTDYERRLSVDAEFYIKRILNT